MNPGHGNGIPTRDPTGFHYCLQHSCNGTLDDVQGLPVASCEWNDFVNSINRIVKLADGIHVVGGLSVGGAAAAVAGLDSLDSDGSRPLYLRQLIINPMTHAADPKQEIESTVMADLPVTRDFWIGWGPGCREERKLRDRGGFCTFQVKHGVAAGRFGIALLDRKPLSVSNASTVTLMYDQGDNVVSTQAIRDLYGHYHDAIGSRAATCVQNFTSHSMLSPHDDPGLNRYWLNELYCQIVDYMAEGRPFGIEAAQSKAEGGDHYCRMECTADTCPYNRSVPMQCPYHR